MKQFRKQLLIILAVMLVLVLSACNMPVNSQSGEPTAILTGNTPTETPPQSGQDAASLLSVQQWRLDSYGAPGAETPVIAGTDVTLHFSQDGQAGGSAGCNSFGAQYQTSDGQISFSQVISTLMACADENVMTQEHAYLQALQAAGTYTLSEGRLTLTTQDGNTVLNFVPGSPQSTEVPTSTLMCEPTETTTANGWTLCHSLLYGFMLRYPADAVLTDQRVDYARIDLTFTEGTNLTEKYLEIAYTDTTDSCTSPLAEGHSPGSIPEETVVLNGKTFLKQTGTGVATGNIYDWEAYSIAQDNRCISLDFVLHSFHPELAPTPPPEFDRAAESAIFTQIAETFTWIGTPQVSADGGGVVSSPTATPPTTVRPTPEPERITFDTGAISDMVSGSVLPGGMNAYVLRAMAGQTMQVDLTFSEGEAILIIWGEDGTVLISDHAGATSFTGQLPLTQDYYIHVRGNPDTATNYQMDITIQ